MNTEASMTKSAFSSGSRFGADTAQDRSSRPTDAFINQIAQKYDGMKVVLFSLIGRRCSKRTWKRFSPA